MIDRDLTWAKLRENANLSGETVNRLRNSHPVRLLTLKKLLDFLDCDLCDIIEFVPDDNSTSA